MNLKNAIFDYLDKELHRLEGLYKWNFPTKNLPFEYSKKGSNDYQKSLDLRLFLNKKICEGINVAEAQIWYVKDWGGIKGNNESTLARYVSMTNEALLNLGINGISTWSKMLSIRNPEAYAIYDSRVAFTLNGLQRLYEVSNPYLFPLLSSRNTNIAPFHKKIKTDPFYKEAKSTLQFYSIYLDLLHAYVESRKIEGGIQSVEMFLFAMAITDNKNLSSFWR